LSSLKIFVESSKFEGMKIEKNYFQEWDHPEYTIVDALN